MARLLDGGPKNKFLPLFLPLVGQVAQLGAINSLSQTLLKLTSPGVPDIYQGDELETLSLVDPDNRRPVDWERRRRALRSDEPSKLRLIRRVLALRAERPDDFAGLYEPVDLGPDWCAFRRGSVLVSVPLRPGLEVEGRGNLLPEPDLGLYATG